MKSGPETPATKFVFYAHKPKARMLADAFARGAARRGHDLKVVTDFKPLPGRVGIFYGVVPPTYPAFRYYMAEGRAIYLDNGWLSTPQNPTFRFSWNSVQPFLADMPMPELASIYPLPKIERKPQIDLALLILQSPAYFENLRLGYDRGTWERATSRFLTMNGYRVEVREKPTKKDPEAETFFDQMARAGIVVSLNSAAALKALRYGIPAYCLLDCTLSPHAPRKLPKVGLAAPPTTGDVLAMCKRLTSYEITKEQMASGDVYDALLRVPQSNRKGYFYGIG